MPPGNIGTGAILLGGLGAFILLRRDPNTGENLLDRILTPPEAEDEQREQFSIREEFLDEPRGLNDVSNGNEFGSDNGFVPGDDGLGLDRGVIQPEPIVETRPGIAREFVSGLTDPFTLGAVGAFVAGPPLARAAGRRIQRFRTRIQKPTPPTGRLARSPFGAIVHRLPGQTIVESSRTGRIISTTSPRGLAARAATSPAGRFAARAAVPLVAVGAGIEVGVPAVKTGTALTQLATAKTPIARETARQRTLQTSAATVRGGTSFLTLGLAQVDPERGFKIQAGPTGRELGKFGRFIRRGGR